MNLALAAPLSGEPLLLLLVQLAALLALGLVLGRLAVRWGHPAIVGELLTGVVLGPSLLGAFAPDLSAALFPDSAEQSHLLDVVCLLGILLLVGVTGMHLDTGMLVRRTRSVVGVSLGGLLLPFGLGLGLGYLMPERMLANPDDRTTFAIFLGVAMCVSAIPVIAKTLADMRLLHRDIGQLTLAAATVDDAVGWCLLSAVSVLATVGPRPVRLIISMLVLVAFVLFAFLVAAPLVDRLLRRQATSTEAGPPLAAAVVVVLVGAATSQALGLEAVFGAFVGGLLVGRAGLRPEQLAPLRTATLSVLAPIALAAAGLRIDLRLIADPEVLVAALVALVIAVAGKLIGAYAGARLTGLSHWEGLTLGAGLNARGVVEVVVALVGLRLGVLTTATYTIVVVIAVTTSLLAPSMLRRCVAHLEETAEERGRERALTPWRAPVVPSTPSN